MNRRSATFFLLLPLLSLACAPGPADPEADPDLVLGGKADSPEGHTNQFNFVTALYADILGRGASNGEIEGHVSQISSQGPGGVALGMFKSDEYRRNLVTSFYQTFLDREPDAGGLLAHANGSAINKGDPLDSMSGMVASDEFFERAGGTFDGFVTRAYQKVLGRTPGASEISQWSGKPRATVARALLTSEEYHKQQLILGWFDDYLSRGASSSERAQFHSMLEQMNHAQAQVAIVTSREYILGHGSCLISSCVAEGAECGQIDDHCAGTINCGTCPFGQSCGGDGVPNECGCTPISCAAQGKNCGFVEDGCGSQLFCGSCSTGSVCGGDGAENVCSGTTATGAPLRLTSSSLLEVFHQGTWRGVCDDNFGTADATVACRQLGGKLKTFATGVSGPSSSFWLDQLACLGNESALSSCGHGGFGNEDCGSTEWVALSCDVNAGVEGGLRTTSGVLEAFHDNEWRGVCDDLFGQQEAAVACRQLGGSLVSFSTGRSGPSSLFWLDNLSCSGGESKLTSCFHNGFGNEDCGVSEHVSVTCAF